jgi:hypothetical protein
MEIKPCPFCGAGSTDIRPNNYWTGMRSVAVSVEVRHGCDTPKGQPHRDSIVIVRKTESEAIAAWNTRATLSEERKP